jgi:alpha-D-xyloside xylohydrolase
MEEEMKFEKNQHGISINYGKAKLEITIFSPEIVRVKCGPGGVKERKSLVVTLAAEEVRWSVTEDANGFAIITDKLKVKTQKSKGCVAFYDRQGDLLLEEKAGTRKINPAVVSKEKCVNAIQGFNRNKDEGIYGLGQYEEGFMNYKNCEILMVQANRVIVNPFLVSTRGYGILWDNYSETIFRAAENRFSFDSEVSDGVDYYFVYGNDIDGAIKQYRKLTGGAPMFPKWVFGYWQSKERYLDQDELVNILKEYRKRKVPIDSVVQDWRYWGENEVFSGMIWEKYRFPDPKRMMKEIHAQNGHLMASIWPAFGAGSPIYKEMAKHGYLFKYPHWTGSKVYDAFSEKARKIYWKHLKKCLFDTDVDAYWMDGSEPEFVSAEDRFILAETVKSNRNNELGTMARYLNAFSLMTTKGVYENQRAVSDKKRVFILTRSAFAGQQRNASASWSGDTFAGWETFKNQVSSAVNFSMAGVPYWTSDVGAFYPFFAYKDPLNDPAYIELYLRWFQFVSFTPILRTHGTAIPREVWRFGEPGSSGYDTQVKFIKLRYRLMPYIYSTAWKVTDEGYSFIRGMAADFPGDKQAKDTGSQFMFGKSLMACPVTKELYNETKNKGDYIYYRNLFAPDGKEHGLKYEAYDGLDLKDLRATRKLDTSSMGWAGNIPLDIKLEYSQRWTGKILSNEAGSYDFTAITDGSLRLWFDGKLVIDARDNREEKRFPFTAKLKANTKYSIKLEHQQFRMKQAIMRLNWHTPAMKKDEAKKQISVYLPEGKKWFDFWTGRRVKAGDVKLKPAIDTMPLYVPAGSIIPMGPNMQYTSEKPAAPIELRVYTGADAEFNLYEDEGDNYNYENGDYSIIPIVWKEKEKTLIIGKRKGKFPGMLKTRRFDVVFVRPGRGMGMNEKGRPDVKVKYSGKEVFISL